MTHMSTRVGWWPLIAWKSSPVTRSRELRAARSCAQDRKSTRLNSSHSQISYAVFCLKKKKNRTHQIARLEWIIDGRAVSCSSRRAAVARARSDIAVLAGAIANSQADES